MIDDGAMGDSDNWVMGDDGNGAMIDYGAKIDYGGWITNDNME